MAFLNAMCHVLVHEGYVDREFVDRYVRFQRSLTDVTHVGYGDFVLFLSRYAPERVAELCDIAPGTIRAAAHRFGLAGAAMSFWTMGLNQQIHGVAANRLVMTLHLLTGQIGRPGATPFSLTGQPNAGGGVRDTGALAHALPAGRVVSNPRHRAEMERLWNVPPGRISPRPGRAAVALFDAMRTGRVRAALVMSTNPARSLPNAERYREAMERAFVIVSDAIYPTDTAALADVFLPAAMWVEKEGVFSQSERRYHLVRKLVDPPGEARSDLDILIALADRLGHGDLITARTPAAVWDEWRRVSEGTTYDFSGMTYERLAAEPGIRWPCPTPAHPGTNRRFVPGDDPLARASGRIDFYAQPDGRAVVFFSAQRPLAELPDARYPFLLSTGRRLERWHTDTITGRVPQLRDLPVDYLELHPGDAHTLGVAEGDRVRVTSRRGSVVLRARPTDGVAPGFAFAPFHSLEHLVNAPTIDAVDPESQQPDYKRCAVRIERETTA